MDIVPFGRQLIETEDLDPVYCALVRSEFDKAILARWLVAYWCVYHCGSASWIAEQPNFWDALILSAKNATPSPLGKAWPRGTERRHWRGLQAADSVYDLVARGLSPDIMLERLEKAAENGVGRVMEEAQTYRGFGSWIAFKIADMMDRVWGTPVQFDNAIMLMFKDPVKGIDMVEGRKVNYKDRVGVVERLVGEFSDYKAPPRYDRPINVQEVETILCKWKSHQNGHYPIGKDIREIRHGLEGWTNHSELARIFLEKMPPLVSEAQLL